MIKKTLLLGTALVVLTACSHTITKQQEPIKIGFVGALTGDAAIYGEEDRNAAQLAVDEINQKAGVQGKSIKVIYEDGKCSGKDAASAAQKLITVDKVKVILGGSCSGETLAIAPLAEENKVLLLSSYSQSPDITGAGDYVFRNSPSATDTGSATADLAYRNSVKVIAIVAENTDFASSFARVFKQRFESLGGEVAFNEEYLPETTDMRTLLAKALEKNPDAFLISPQGESGIIVVQQLKELGYKGQLYGNIDLGSEEVAKKAQGATEGLYYSDAAGLSERNPKAQEFLANYEKRFGKKPDFPRDAGARYDSVYIIAQAMEQVGYDAGAIKEYLYALEGYDGVIGKTSFDQNGDLEGLEFVDFQVKDGKPQLIEKNEKSPADKEATNNAPVQEVVLKTNKGDITVELFPQRAPLAVGNFLKLARENFYDGVKFHRVIPDFMIQTGDPNSKDDDWSDDGTGGPGYTFADEVSPSDQLVKGAVAMANSGPNTNGSQFFIVTAEATPWLNGKHTIFGRVVKGMDVADTISRVPRNNDQENHPLEDIVIEDVVTK